MSVLKLISLGGKLTNTELALIADTLRRPSSWIEQSVCPLSEVYLTDEVVGREAGFNLNGSALRAALSGTGAADLLMAAAKKIARNLCGQQALAIKQSTIDSDNAWRHFLHHNDTCRQAAARNHLEVLFRATVEQYQTAEVLLPTIVVIDDTGSSQTATVCSLERLIEQVTPAPQEATSVSS